MGDVVIPNVKKYDKKGKLIGGGLQLMNHNQFREGEAPSVNVHASATGLSKIAAFMANNG